MPSERVQVCNFEKSVMASIKLSGIHKSPLTLLAMQTHQTSYKFLQRTTQLVTCPPPANMIPILEDKLDTEALKVLSQIVSRYFSNSTVMLIGDEKHLPQCRDVISTLISLTTLIIYTNIGLHLQTKSISTHVKTKPQLFIYIPGPGQNFHFRIFKSLTLKQGLWNWHEAQILIFSKDFEELPAVKVTSDAWRATGVANIAMLNSEGALFKWTPHAPNNCHHVRGLIKSNVNDLYEPYGNLTGCTLRAATFYILPYVAVTREPTDKFRGLEVDIAYTLAKHHGMNIEFVKRTYGMNETSWTIRMQNGSAGGAMFLLSNHQADMAFSSFALSAARYEVADPLFPHTMDEVTWFTPAPKSKKVFFNVGNSFGGEWWCIIFGILISVMAGYYLSEPKYSISDAFFRTFNVLLGGAVKNGHFPSSNQLTIFLYLCALHLLVAYQIQLIKSLVKPEKEPPIASLEDGVNRGMHFLLIASLADHYTPDTPGWEFFQNPEKWTMSQNPPEDLNIVAKSTNQMALQPKYSAIFYIGLRHLNEYGDSAVYYLRDRYMPLPISMYMYKGHFLFNKFQKTTMNLVEGGLTQYWLKNFLLDKKYKKNRQTITPIAVHHLTDPFSSYTTSLIIAFAVFILELVINRLKKTSAYNSTRRKIQIRMLNFTEKNTETEMSRLGKCGKREARADIF